MSCGVCHRLLTHKFMSLIALFCYVCSKSVYFTVLGFDKTVNNDFTIK